MWLIQRKSPNARHTKRHVVDKQKLTHLENKTLTLNHTKFSNRSTTRHLRAPILTSPHRKMLAVQQLFLHLSSHNSKRPRTATDATTERWKFRRAHIHVFGAEWVRRPDSLSDWRVRLRVTTGFFCMSVLTRKKCAVARSKNCILCTPPVAFSELRLTGRDNATKQKQIWMAVRGRGSYRECFLEVSYHSFPWLVCTSGTASSITSGLTTYHPAAVLLPYFPSRRPLL